MSKHRNENANPRTAAEVEIELADALADRKELGRRIRALRDELDAAVAAEERARAEAIGARILAAAGNPDAILAIAAEVAETADSGAAPPAPEAAPPASDDGDEQPVEHHHEHRGWGGDHG